MPLLLYSTVEPAPGQVAGHPAAGQMAAEEQRGALVDEGVLVFGRLWVGGLACGSRARTGRGSEVPWSASLPHRGGQ